MVFSMVEIINGNNELKEKTTATSKDVELLMKEVQRLNAVIEEMRSEEEIKIVENS